MRQIDVSFWNANLMPVVIASPLGYATDSVPIRGGIRAYHWFRIWKLGIEVTVARATVQQGLEYERSSKPKSTTEGT